MTGTSGVLRLSAEPTAALSGARRQALRALLDLAYDGDFGEDDWDHALGGTHVLAVLGEGPKRSLIGHASVVQRQLLVGEAPCRAGYVEAVAVHPAHRRRGVGDALMSRIQALIRRTWPLGALSITEDSARLYQRHGWLPWRGPTWALTPTGASRTQDEDGGVYVYPVAGPLDLDQPLTCDFRRGDLW